MRNGFIKKPPISVVMLKHLEDFFIGVSGMFVLAGLFPIISLLIVMESGGPVIYRQRRVGLNKRQPGADDTQGGGRKDIRALREGRAKDVGGRTFTLYKFRTMYLDAEQDGPKLCSPHNDPRITRIGKWLRLTHLDELPQIWNILKGEMSFIGPRPERPCFTRRYISKIRFYSARTVFHKPGLTGLAQIKTGYDSDLGSVIRKFEMDVSYTAAAGSLASWIRMEARVIYHTVLYILKTLRTRQRTLVSTQLMRFREGSAPYQGGANGWPIRAAAYVSHPLAKKTVVLDSHSISELGAKIDNLDAGGKQRIEISMSVRDKLDNEEVFHLARLIRNIKGAGGRLSVSGEGCRTQDILHELKFSHSLTLEKERFPVQNFLTIDVECWFHAHNLKEKVPKSTWHRQPAKVVSNIQRILQLLKAYDTRATFFVLGWVADRFPEVVHMIDEAGHEIGTHGYYHDLIYEMTPDAFEHDLVKSLEAIGRHTGKPILGHRASNFSIVPSTFWALEIMRRHGIVYDSSIFPIQRKRYGIANYPNRLPHRVDMSSGKSIQEFPMGTLKVGKWNLPIAGGGYLRLFPYELTAEYVSRMNRQGNPVMVYFHPWEIDTEQEKLKVGYKKRFMHYVNIETTEWKIFRLLEHFNFTSISESRKVPEMQSLLKSGPVALHTSQGELLYMPRACPRHALERRLVGQV